MTKKDNNLPGTWKLATIGELIGVNGVFVDGDWVESKDQDPSGDVRLIQLADIGDGIFRDKSARFLTKSKAYELRCTFLQNGDILIARMPEPLGRACMFPRIGEEKYVTVVDVCIVRPGHNDISNKYLTYAINSPQVRHEIDKYKTGSTRKRISRKNLARVNLPIAPLPEQHRIVAKIEQLFSELDKGVAELKKAREKLELYRQSLLKAAFEGRLTEQWRKQHADELESAEELLARIKAEREKRYQQQLEEWKQAVKEWEAQGKPGKKPKKPRKPKELPPLTEEELAELPELPEGWGWDLVGNLFEVASGNTPKGVENCKRGDIPYYRVSDMNLSGNEQWMTTSRTYLTEKDVRSLGLRIFPKGTIIFPKRGGAILTNKKRILSKPSCIDLNTMGIINASNCLHNDYVWWWLFNLDLSKIYDGSNVPQINNKNVEPLPFPLCSFKEQVEIAKEVESRLEICNLLLQTIDTALAHAELLRQAILKKAFSGKLVPQDPNDEPASELLKRIKAEREKAAKKKKPAQKTRKKKEGKRVRDLLTALTQAGDWISAQEAFRQCGISDGAETDQIEPIYMELRDLVNSGKVIVERRGEEDWLKLKDTQEA